MGVGYGTAISVIVAIISTWIIVMLVNLPPELIDDSFYTFIRSLPYIELQFLFILGGDPINHSEQIYQGLLLNFNAYPYINVALWFSSGFVGAIFTRNIIKGVGVGINAGIVTAIIGWFLYWAILFGFDINALMSSQMLSLLNTYCVNGLIDSIFASIGGLIGGIVGSKSGK
ncbi:MAG: hypothetical protein ACTSYR_04590 [Candidatus Odinarchaeia archaeon]